MGVLLSFAGAFLLGFAAHRSSLCAVKAVAETMTTGRVVMLAFFFKITIWVVSLSVLGLALFGISAPVVHWPATLSSIAGGLLFGVGATANGGCTFSTLRRLGDGETNLAATVAGWLAGASIERSVLSGHSPVATRIDMQDLVSGPAMKVAVAAAGVFLIWQTIVIIRSFPTRAPLARALLAPNYRLSAAAALIGAASYLIYVNLGAWSLTSVILSTAAPSTFPPTASLPVHWLTLAFTLAGMIASSALRRSFSLSGPKPGRLAVHGGAGLAMGFGAAMMPGGNDTLILYGVGFLSPHALPAFASIFAGVALTFLVARRFGGVRPSVHYSEDFCTVSTPIVASSTASFRPPSHSDAGA